MDIQSGKCQMMSVYEAAENLSLDDKFAHWFYFRGPAALRRRLERFKKWIGFSAGRTDPSAAQRHASGEVRDGERYFVRVKSLEEIKKTLDANGHCRGLMFMPGQAVFCGQTFEVLKEVDWMFDEREWKMKKIRNAVLLKDVICDGSDMYDKEGCSRSCFYYWKTDWLERV